MNSYPMVVEMAKGADIGSTRLLLHGVDVSQILTPVLSGFFMEYVGYWTLFPYATIFMIIAFITMSQVKHGDAKAITPKNTLEFLDVED